MDSTHWHFNVFHLVWQAPLAAAALPSGSSTSPSSLIRGAQTTRNPLPPPPPRSDFKANPDYKGVCHVALAQEGHCKPGEVLFGTDSHTCNAGAFGQFATGVGNTDAGFILGTGKLLIKVPPTMRFQLEGEVGGAVRVCVGCVCVCVCVCVGVWVCVRAAMGG